MVDPPRLNLQSVLLEGKKGSKIQVLKKVHLCGQVHTRSPPHNYCHPKIINFDTSSSSLYNPHWMPCSVFVILFIYFMSGFAPRSFTKCFLTSWTPRLYISFAYVCNFGRIIHVLCMKSPISLIQNCTLCYLSMPHATLILFYNTSMFAPHTSIISHALWLP